MGYISANLTRLGSTPTADAERVGATPTAEGDYLGGLPLATLVGVGKIPTAMLEHLGGMTVDGSLFLDIGRDTLDISESSLSFANTIGMQKTFSVMATSYWTAELIDDFGLFSISTTSGVGGMAGELTITLVAENTDLNDYSASIIVRCGGLRKELMLTVAASTATYTQLTYIECTGQQYIDLGYMVKEDDVIEADFIRTNIQDEDQYLFGTTDGNTGLWFDFISNTLYARFGQTSTTGSTSISSASGNYSMRLEKGQVIIGTTSKSLGAFTQMPNNTINLFAGRNSNGEPYYRGYYRCSKFRISDSNGLVMDLVPVKRDSDGKIGMLDSVSGTFFVNNDIGEDFIAGAEIRTTPEYELIDYVTFTKDKLYDLGIVKSTYTLEVMFKRSESSATPYLYGIITNPHTASVTAYMSSGGAWRFGAYYKGLSTNNTNTNYTIIKSGNVNFNFTSSTFTKSTFTTPNTVVLGGYRAASGALTKNYQGRVYFFRITEGSTPIIDYYPCKRLSDGVEGFWDCVSQTFIEPM